MRIQKITTQQPQFKAVNQKYMAWAKKDYSRVENVSGEWLDRLSFDVFLFKKIAKFKFRYLQNLIKFCKFSFFILKRNC